MILVYHNPKTNFFHANPDDVFVMTDDELVAKVDVNDLEDAFRLTNSIDSHWSENKEVTAIKKTRSTSVGDFMVLDGKWYQVAPVGFELINKN